MRSLTLLITGCSGWVGELDVFCPDIPLGELTTDELLPTLGVSVQQLPLFDPTPRRVAFEYDDGSETQMSFRITASEASIDDGMQESCHDLTAAYTLELFTDDGAFDWLHGDVERMALDAWAGTRAVVVVPFVRNVGRHGIAYGDWAGRFLVQHPDLAAESLEPVAYRLELDLVDVNPQGSLTLVVSHDPVSDAEGVVRTVTEWVVGTF